MKIDIFGLGAIGSNLLLQLAKKYPNIEFMGIDYDVVEERNIMTQAYLIPHIGIKKVLAMQGVLGLNLRKFKYSPLDMKMTHKKHVANLKNIKEEHLMIDCFDNSESRKLFESANGWNPDILHIGFSPQYTAEIIWHENYSVPNDIPEEQDDICEMREAVPFITFVTGFATGVISDFIESKTKSDYIITNKYNIKKLS